MQDGGAGAGWEGEPGAGVGGDGEPGAAVGGEGEAGQQTAMEELEEQEKDSLM